MKSVNWEEKYLARDTPWDKGKPAPPLMEYLETHTLHGKILVPGCGVGHDVRLLAEQDAHVTGLDVAPSAIRKASSLEYPSNVQFQVGDFFDLPEHWYGYFDIVFEHTCFCAIRPEQRLAYVAAAHHVLKEDGHLLAIFFNIVDNPDPDQPPFPVATADIDRLFDGHFETIQQWTPTKTYACRQGGKEQMRWMRKKNCE